MKISKVAPANSITMKTTTKKDNLHLLQWWTLKDDNKMKDSLIATATYLKESQSYRYRQAAIYARLYGNMSLFNFIGTSMSKLDSSTSGLPLDRPTFNVIQSCIDTLVSRIGQNRPSPVFLTDNGDYKERNLAKKLNNFVGGEFYQTKAYEKAAVALRDALVEGMGILHIYETNDHKVGLERVLLTELLVDQNEAMYGDPRQMYRIKLVDREVIKAAMKGKASIINSAEQAYPDDGADSSKTVSDLIMVVEAWRLPSGKDTKDGRHTLACSAGIIYDEPYDKQKFPFVFLPYSERLLGFWPQGLAEQLMGTQLEINALLYTISRAIKLVGVPRVFVEMGSKVTKTSQNNDVGVIVEYKGTKPSYEVAPCVPQEMYAQLQRQIDYGYRQSGVPAMQASSVKPAGLNSGEAIRSYDDISSDRFALLGRKWDNFFIELAYQVIDKAMDISKEQGSYSTVYPNKDGVKEIDLPKMSLLKDPFVIQCFNMSSLPKDPAGRMQKVVEMMQSGMITVKEGRRLLDFPDLGQMEKLANASEERIFQMLDDIVEDGKYIGPDPFLDLQLASELTVQYINLYTSAKLEEEKCQMLRDFYNQIQGMIQAAQPQPMPGAQETPPGGAPQPTAVPQAPEQSDMLPNTPQQG